MGSCLRGSRGRLGLDTMRQVRGMNGNAIQRGELLHGGEVFDELRERIEERRRAKAANP